MTYVLILMMVITGNGQVVPVSIPGFISYKQCVIAGDKWTKEAELMRYTLETKFVCVEQGKH